MKQLDTFQKMVDNLSPEQPMDEEQTGMYFSLMIGEAQNPELREPMTADDPILKETEMWIPRVFISRLESLTTLKITRAAAVSMFINFNGVGTAVLYAYYLHRKCEPETLVTMKIIDKLFKGEFISPKQHEELWDAQKLYGEEAQEEAKPLQCYMVPDNLLDYVGTWKEIEVEV